ncbi:MAG: glycosyltransferase family 2 protein [Clostridia bacterium]|nr:glycosyltransferase family 2 protein [Clostridia bacterium]
MIPKISVVTRAYNAEKYIRECIESVLGQSFTEFEYFIIENGSIDGTRRIVEEYAVRDERIKAIYLEKNDVNVSAVKLLAERGSGEYFMSLDSDDWLEKECMKELYNGVKETGADIAVGGTCFRDGNKKELGMRKSDNAYFIARESIADAFRLLHQFFRPVWGKLFSAALVKENLERINEKRPSYLMYGGDTYTSLEFLKKANGVYLSNKVLHNYRIHPSSVSYKYYGERFQSDVFLFRHAKELLQEFGEVSKENESFLFAVYFNAIQDTLNVLLASKENNLEKLEQLAVIFGEQTTKELFSLYGNEKICRLLKDIFHLICEIAGSYQDREEFEKCLLAIANVSGLFDNCGLSGKFVMNYRNIMLLALENKWTEMKEKVIELLAEKKISLPEEEVMLNILLRLSALTEDTNVFLLANKLLVRNLVKQEKNEEAKEVLSEIEEMVPTDPDIEILKDEIKTQ